MNDSARQLIRDVLIMLALTLLLGAAAALAQSGAADPASIRLHDEVAAAGPEVRLADVAELSGAAAEFADTIVGRFDDGNDTITIGRNALRTLLDEGGVNLGLTTLTGYTSCVVARRSEANAQATDAALLGENAEPAVVSNPAQPVTLDAAATLREQVIQLIETLAEAPRSELRLRFVDGDGDRLDRGALQDRYELEPATAHAAALRGRVPVIVRRYQRDRLVETFNITVDVARRYQAVVALRGVSRGQTLTPSDVALREVYLDDVRGEPMTALDAVIGQSAAGLVREGSVLFPDHLRSPRVVRRGELITVRSLAGGLVLKTVLRAGQDGALGETITARNERSRQTLSVRVTGLREGVAIESETQTQGSGT